jgi:hypothetical protein
LRAGASETERIVAAQDAASLNGSETMTAQGCGWRAAHPRASGARVHGNGLERGRNGDRRQPLDNLSRLLKPSGSAISRIRV